MAIVSTGGGIMIDAKTKTTSDLMEIVSAAARSGATVILTGLGSKTTSDLMGIGSTGKDHVILDLRLE
jgi:hypothetical protein